MPRLRPQSDSRTPADSKPDGTPALAELGRGTPICFFQTGFSFALSFSALGTRSPAPLRAPAEPGNPHELRRKRLSGLSRLRRSRAKEDASSHPHSRTEY